MDTESEEGKSLPGRLRESARAWGRYILVICRRMGGQPGRVQGERAGGRRCTQGGAQGQITQDLVGEHKEFGFYFEYKRNILKGF